MAEIYEGVKFKTIFLSNTVPQDFRLRSMKYWAGVFNDKGLAPPYEGGSAGNISFRLRKGSNEFIITASKTGMKDTISDDCFVKVVSCDMSTEQVFAEGIREPSSESRLHWAIYKARQDVDVIFHGHCEALLANAQKLNVPETSRFEEYGTTALIESVMEILGNHNFVLMKDHGFISMGPSRETVGKQVLKMLGIAEDES